MKDQITISRRALMGLYLLVGLAAGIIISDITRSSFIEPAYAAAGSGKLQGFPDVNGGIWVLDTETGITSKCTVTFCGWNY